MGIQNRKFYRARRINPQFSTASVPLGYCNLGPTNSIVELDETERDVLLLIDGHGIWLHKSTIIKLQPPAGSMNPGYYWCPRYIADRNKLTEYRGTSTLANAE